MAQTFGITTPDAHQEAPDGPPVRYAVLIDSASEGGKVARLFLASREPVATFEASAPEIQLMLQEQAPSGAADAAEWDTALAGHSAGERRAAQVFELDP